MSVCYRKATLRTGLAPGDQGTDPGPSLDLARLWLDRERPDRPLVVILDQAEEAFTRPRVAAPAGDDEALKKSWIDSDAELAELLAALRDLRRPGPRAAAPGQADRLLPQRVARPVRAGLQRGQAGLGADQGY